MRHYTSDDCEDISRVFYQVYPSNLSFPDGIDISLSGQPTSAMNVVMSLVASISIHPTQFPANIQRDLLESIRTRCINHKFHYDSVKQTQKWLQVHQTYSPSRTDPDVIAIYDQSFTTATASIGASNVHCVGIGCGGGQKDTRLLRLLQHQAKQVAYTPADVSTAMTLVAREIASSVISADDCHPLVCDLATAQDLPQVLDELVDPEDSRLITCFGILPNFRPGLILPKLAALVRSGDFLLLSANLAPGKNYAAGVRSILPSYDNTLTTNWLMTLLNDLGVDSGDGTIQFGVEACPDGTRLKRICAQFTFLRERTLNIGKESFEFQPEESVQLFFSYRHTPKDLEANLPNYGLKLVQQWISRSEEEGIFLCRKF